MRVRTRFVEYEGQAYRSFDGIGWTNYHSASTSANSQVTTDMVGSKDEWHQCEIEHRTVSGFARLHTAPRWKWEGDPVHVFNSTFPSLDPNTPNPLSPFGPEPEITGQKLWALLANTTNQVQSLPFLYEARQAIGMLRKPWKLLTDKRMRKLTRPRTPLKEAIDQASNTWLEGRYGWLPFISDLSGAVKAFHTASDFETKGYHKFDLIISNGFSREISVGAWSGKCIEDQVKKMTIYGRLIPTFEALTKSRLQLALDGYGVNAGSLITTAWEVIPYSFVLDWFAPVGDMLERRFSPMMWSRSSLEHSSSLLVQTCNCNIHTIDGNGFTPEPFEESTMNFVTKKSLYVREPGSVKALELLDGLPTSSGVNYVRFSDGIALLKNILK